jgi:glycosyltransferase involved in cell wall biosynthesis
MDEFETLVCEATDRETSRPERLRLFFLIRSLEHGGAERQLTELVKRLDPSRFEVIVATFYDGGALRSEIDDISGVHVISLGKKDRWDLVPFIWRLARVIRKVRPHVLHGYMGNANELCLLMARLFGGRAVWGLRMSDRDLSCYDWLSAWTLRTGSWLSRFADLIIVNSFAGKRDHTARGYAADRMVVVHNGIDTARFRPNTASGRERRREWSVAKHEFLVGMIGRLDPQKDHPTFLRAAALTAKQRAGVRFICVGNGSDEHYKKQLQTLAGELGLGDRLIWAPASNKVLGLYNAMDLVTLTSRNGEGFANVIGEAMSCGVPVVVTDAGDLALIVGNKTLVVPIQQPEALAAAWCRVIDMTPAERKSLGFQERARIVGEFNVEQLVKRTVAAIESLQ